MDDDDDDYRDVLRATEHNVNFSTRRCCVDVAIDTYTRIDGAIRAAIEEIEAHFNRRLHLQWRQGRTLDGTSDLEIATDLTIRNTLDGLWLEDNHE